jgi:dual-specificity kinase
MSCRGRFFKTREKKLDYPNHETPKASRKYVRAMKRLEVRSLSLLPTLLLTNTLLQDTITPHNEFNKQFLDLLRRIFVYNPSKRITAKQALKHPWFREALQDDGTEAARIREEKLAKRLAAASAAQAQSLNQSLVAGQGKKVDAGGAYRGVHGVGQASAAAAYAGR